jgi:hypothetical protein
MQRTLLTGGASLCALQASMLCTRGLLGGTGGKKRTMWVADSFEGMPPAAFSKERGGKSRSPSRFGAGQFGAAYGGGLQVVRDNFRSVLGEVFGATSAAHTQCTHLPLRSVPPLLTDGRRCTV